MQTETRPELTDRQKEVFDFLRSFQAEHGWMPSLREIAVELGVSSLNGVAGHLDALERKGWIVRGGGARTIRLLEADA
jgi:repressor LexA